MIVSLAQRTSNVTVSNTAWTLLTGSTPGRARVLEIGIFLAAATASTFGLGRPAALGITPTTPVDFLPEDPNDVLATGIVQGALAWGTLPTAPTQFLRRISLPATIGTGVIWTFPRGLVIPVSSNLVVYNITATGVADVYAVIDL
jgi:hypothetical protein